MAASSHSLYPKFQWIHEIPGPFIDSARFLRVHKRILKESVRELMEEHHKKVLPKHFTREARSRYDHKARTPGWRKTKRKKYGSVLDLVASGKTRDSMLKRKPVIRVGGDGERSLHATIELKFPFDRSKDNPKKVEGKVSIKDMSAEIATWAADETAELGDNLAAKYATKLQAVLATAPKWRSQAKAKGII